MPLYLSSTCPNCKSDEWEVEVEGGTIISEYRDEVVKCPICGVSLLLEIEVRASIYKFAQQPLAPDKGQAGRSE